MENSHDQERFNRDDSERKKSSGSKRPRINRPSGEGSYNRFTAPNKYGDRQRIDDENNGNYRPRRYSNDGDNRGNNYRSPNSFNRNRDNGGYNQNRQNENSGYRPRTNSYGNNRPYSGGYSRQDGEGGYSHRDSNGGDQQRNTSYRSHNYRSNGNNYNNNTRNGGYSRPNYQSRPRPVEYKKQYVDYTQPMRLNKFLANAGICSRREADEFIEAGVVSVNGEIVTQLGTKIIPATDKVLFHDQLVHVEKKVYILLNKPKDVVTTADDEKNRKTVLDIVKNACNERVYPVGRLDRNTTGVLLITNDGDLTSKLTHPQYEKKKIYHLVLDKPLSAEDKQTILKGVTLEDGEIYADEIAYTKDDDQRYVGIEIHSGKNRIVRRIFDHFGYHVLKLDRVYFAGLTKKNLPRGKWRFLSESEVNMLKMGVLK